MVAVFSPSSTLQAIDGIAFLAELGELTCASGLELLDAHFQSTCRHGKFGAQLILVRLNLGHRQWSGGFEAAHRQTYGARHEQEERQRVRSEPRQEIRSPKYMIGSIMKRTPPTHCAR